MPYSHGFLLNEIIAGLAVFLLISYMVSFFIVDLHNYITLLKHRSELLDYTIQLPSISGIKSTIDNDQGYEIQVSSIGRPLKKYVLQSIIVRDLRFSEVQLSVIALQKFG